MLLAGCLTDMWLFISFGGNGLNKMKEHLTKVGYNYCVVLWKEQSTPDYLSYERDKIHT
jgi:hypothetical protein